MTEDHHVFEFPNDIRFVYKQVKNTRVFHCGFILDVGSRDELPFEQGLAHFWEHMAFKGTRKRKSFHILNSLDSVGGELNAFTDKEKVMFFASVRDQHTERAIDLLADITFNSVFPLNQIEKERGVILEEMAMYFDHPDDSLQDEFEALLYKNHPMGMNILGRPETIQSFTRNDFIKFYKGHIDTHRIVFSCVGDLPELAVERLARKYLEGKPRTRTVPRVKSSGYKPKQLTLHRPVKQARCAIGRPAYPIGHKHRIPFYMLVNMLGGPGMNSRLNFSLRERYGYVYSIDAHYVPYTDTGMFAIFFGTEPKQLDRCISLIRKELDRFCHVELSPRQLKAAKEQLMGQMAMAEENNLSLMMMMGRMMLELNRIPALEEIFTIIRETDASLIKSIAQEMFNERKLSYLKMIPEKKS